jgi:hypothetical protein
VGSGSVLSGPEDEEERVAAELGLLGIRYLSRRTFAQVKHVRPPDILLADLVRQAESASPHERLVTLGRQHRQRAQACANWTGTCENVAQHLLRSWELEARWKQ